MTVSELRLHLEELEFQGHGDVRVVAYAADDSEPYIFPGLPTIESLNYVWDDCKLIREEHPYLVI